MVIIYIMSYSNRILVVDDEHSMREMVSILLRRHGYEVITANSGSEAIALFESGEQFDLIVTDLLMDHGGGIEVLSAVKAGKSGSEVIVVTAFGTAESAVEAMKKGAFDYVTKPFNVDEFIIIVRQALERRALIRENLDLKARVRGEFSFNDIVCRSHAMKEVIAVCRKVADSPSTVLISGESGTGKEIVARAIHFASNRAQKPFVAVNCGALPEQLMESEMFGHEKGAFTGADKDKDGLFRAGNNGTVFLDEIGELPPPLQVKMLRVLQERVVRPVGASTEEPVNVRLIAATNQDLKEQVKKGLFRTDLFYRLNVINVMLPVLSERKEDIPLLIEHLLVRLSQEQGTPRLTVTQGALRILLQHDYPGNVRELANMLERAAILTSSDKIDVEDLPKEIISPLAAKSQLLTLPEQGLNIEDTLQSIEQDLINQALERSKGNRTKAALLLGISFRSFRYRLSKLGMSANGSSDN